MRTASVPLISVHDRQRKIRVDRAALEQFATRALRLCMRQRARGPGLASLEEIDVLLISDRRMSELHRKFMEMSGPTDVITFQHGEIFISAGTAKRQARRHRSTLANELRLYLVHGLLHLHGFDDQSPKEKRLMDSLQTKILAAAQSPNG